MSTKSKPVISTGIVSLISFFSILLLATLTVLMLSSARADSTLSDKAAVAVTEYYLADSMAEQTLADIQVLRLQGGDLASALTQNGFTLLESTSKDQLLLSYTIPINDQKQLYVEIGVPIDQNEAIQRLRWQTVVAQ